jgi:autotransporter-associated beta strand protein
VLGLALVASSEAQLVTLNDPGDGAAGTTSWNVAGRWSDGLAPSDTKDYANLVSGRLLRTPNNSTASTTFAGRSLTLSNGATLIHKGANNTTVTVADLRLDNGGVVSVVDSGRTLTLAGNLAIGSGGGVFSVTQNLGTTMAIASTVSGSAPLGKTNAGTVRLDGDFGGYTGTFTVSTGGARFNSTFGGSVIASDASTISGEATISGNLELNGGTLLVNAQSPASLFTSGNLTLNGVTSLSLADGLPSSTVPFTVLSYGNTLAGSAANLVLAGAANYRSPTLSTDTPQIITLAVGSEARTWTGANGTLWDLNSSANWLEGDQRFFQVDAVTFGDTGAGEVAITGVLTPASITIDSSQDYNFTAAAGNQIAGSTGLTKRGTGTASIGGANTFYGGITVAGGTLRGNGFSQVFGANGQVITVQSGATLDFNGSTTAARDFNGVIVGPGVGGLGAVVNNGASQQQGFRSLTLTGNATVGGTAQWDVRPITAGNGLLDLAGFTLTKVGANNINIADSVVTADGSIQITEGTVSVARGTFGGAGSFDVAGGAALRIVNFTSGSFDKAIHLADNATLYNAGATFTLGSVVTVSGNAIIDVPSNALLLANPLVGTGNIEKIGVGNLVLQAPLVHDGTTTITAGALFLDSASSTTIDLAARPILGTGTLAFGRTGGNVSTVYTLSGNSAFQGNFRGVSGIIRISSPGSLGTLPPDPADPENATLPKTISMIVRGAEFHLDGSAGDIVLPAGYNFTISNDVPANPAIGNLAGDNTIGGNINVTDGGGAGAISVFGGSLTLAGNITNLSSPRNVLLGGTGGTGTVSGVISNGGNPLGVEKTGPNTWILSADNTYSGVTTISGGTLQVGDGGGTGTAGLGNVVNNGSLVIHRGGSFTFANAISGTGSLTHSGSATTILGAAGSYSGDTIVSAGTLSPSFPSLDDESTIRLSGGGTLDLFHAQTDEVKSLVIDEVPQASGLWGRIGSIAALGADFETARITGDGLLDVTTGGSVATPFQTWIGGFPAIPLDQRDPEDDPDGDGVPNSLEFALNGDPGDGSNNGLAATLLQDSAAPAGNELTLVVAVRDGVTFAAGGSGAQTATAPVDGFTYSIEGGTGLVFPAAAVSHVSVSDTAPAATGLPDLTGSGWEYHTFRLDGSEGLGGRGFLRVKVTP